MLIIKVIPKFTSYRVDTYEDNRLHFLVWTSKSFSQYCHILVRYYVHKLHLTALEFYEQEHYY